MAAKKKPAAPKRGLGGPNMIGDDTWPVAETWTAQHRREGRAAFLKGRRA